MLLEMDEKVAQIRQRLKEENDRLKSYANAKRTPKEFEVGGKVLLKVKPSKECYQIWLKYQAGPKICGTLLSIRSRESYSLWNCPTSRPCPDA